MNLPVAPLLLVTEITKGTVAVVDTVKVPTIVVGVTVTTVKVTVPIVGAIATVAPGRNPLPVMVAGTLADPGATVPSEVLITKPVTTGVVRIVIGTETVCPLLVSDTITPPVVEAAAPPVKVTVTDVVLPYA